jgi:thiol:disulfide interchange protein DsbD
MGWLRFTSRQSKPALNPWRIGGTLVSVVFAAYLAYGLISSAPLRLLSGFPPPDFYSLRESATDCPLGLECYKDFESGLEKARETDKPILLDFTGWACVNCRKMEEQVWSQPEIYRMLNEGYILISLYVDDREALPEAQQFDYQFANGRIKKIRTVGDLWSTFQTINFGAISQPYYVQLSPELKVLNAAIQNADADRYRDWLASGLESVQITAESP